MESDFQYATVLYGKVKEAKTHKPGNLLVLFSIWFSSEKLDAKNNTVDYLFYP